MKKTAKGMKREDKTLKPNYLHYLPPHVLKRYGEHMLAGAKVHGSGNFLKGGYPEEEYLASAYRHLIALAEHDSSEDHAAALMFNAIGFMHEQSL